MSPAGSEHAGPSPPAVSVVISTYDSRPYLMDALGALAAQTLAPDQVEIVVVDDGSTDGTWDVLQALAARRDNLRIFTQANTGGPSAGRNRGLAAATGRYVFFHDADDYLGPDALRRLVCAAEEEDADIVVGHVRRVGLPTSHRPANRTARDADLLRDGVWRSLGPHKLFRRELLTQHGLRFPEDMVQGEDQVFVAGCLFAARKVTMLGDYDFYYRRTREDLGNLSAHPQSLTNKLLTSTRMTSLVVAHTAPGARRDALLRRVLLGTLTSGLSEVFPTASPEEQRAFLATIQREVLPHLTSRHLRRAEPATRLRLLTARAGSAEQLRELHAVLARPWRYRVEDGELVHDLGPDLNALLGIAARGVRGTLPLAHEISRVRPVRSGLALELRLAPTDLPVEDVQLAARAGRGPWRDLGAEIPSADGEVVFTLRPATWWADGPPPGERWDLRLTARGGGIVLARTPLTWPAPASRLPGADRSVTLRARGWWDAKLYRSKDGTARLRVRPSEPPPRRGKLTDVLGRLGR